MVRAEVDRGERRGWAFLALFALSSDGNWNILGHGKG